MNVAGLKEQAAEAIPTGMTAARKCGTPGARLKSSADSGSHRHALASHQPFGAILSWTWGNGDRGNIDMPRGGW